MKSIKIMGNKTLNGRKSRGVSEIVALCGEIGGELERASRVLVGEGKVVIPLVRFGEAGSPEKVKRLEILSLARIDLAKSVCVFGIGYSISERVLGEILYAKRTGKEVRYFWGGSYSDER